MKRIITSIALILGFLVPGRAQLLPANQCESQSPCNARAICGNVSSTAFSYVTTPASNPITVCGAFTYSSNWVYYRFTCYTTGNLNFRLVPNDSTLVGTDLDWALWNITTTGCGSLSAGNLVSCNAAGAGPVVAGTTFSATGILTAGVPAANFQPSLAVVAGTTYILGISNPTGANTSGFNLNFGLSTTSVIDNKRPYMASVIPFDPCSPVTNLKIKLSEPVRCDNLAAFTGDYTFSSTTPTWTAAGQGCSGCTNAAPNTNPNFYGNATDTLSITFASALAPGTYTISANPNAWFDLCGKSDSVSATLTFTVPAPFAIDIHTGFDCDTLKYIDTVYGVNGLSPYQYKAVGGGLAAAYGVYGTPTPSYTIYKVAGGTAVTYTVKDAGGCEVTSTLNRPSVLSLGAPNLSASSGPPCHDQFSLDSITVISQSGGLGPYTFSLAPVYPWTFVAPNKWKNIVFPGLGATFTVTVTDAHGCTRTGVKNMVNPSVVSLSSPTSTNPICNGDSTGKLCFNSATGGTPLYTYAISPTYPNVTQTSVPNICFNNLPAGTYTITVTDANGCTATATKILSQPSPVTFSAASLITQPTCPNNCDGKYKPVGLGGSGGKKFYKYPYVGPGLWDYADSVVVTTGPLSTFNNLCPGTYTIIAKDAIGCTATTTIVLDHPPYPILTVGAITPVACFGGTGSIPVNVTAGTGNQFPPTAYTVANYTYMPSPVTGMAVNVTAAGGGVNATYTGVPAGSYDLIVTNNNGCADTVFGVIMTEPLAPLSYTSVVVDSVLCFQSSTGMITAQAAGGTQGANAYQYAIKSSTGSFSAYSAATLAPHTFNGLSAGTYTIRARDQNNCTVDSVVTVYEPTDLNLLLDDVDATCFGTSDGEICVIDTGGIADYRYKLGAAGIYSSFQPAGSVYCFNNLAAGNYSIYTIDAKGCLDTLVVPVNSIPLPIVSFTAAPNDTVCDGTAVTLNGTGADTYSWAGLPAINDGVAFTPSVGLTQYIVTGVNTTTGCENMDTAYVLVNPIPVLNDPADKTVCNNTSTPAVNFTSNVAGTTYTWTHDATAAIGIGTSGSGTIPSFIAINTGSTPLVVTFTVTPTGPATTNCVGADQTFTLTIYPTPLLTDPTDQEICAGDMTVDVLFASSVTGTAFSWINSNNTTGLATFSGNGDILAFTGLNTTNLPNVSNITVTPSANGCPGANQSFSITVNPIPVVTDPADQILCNGASTTAVNFISTVASTQFNWTNSDPSIGLLASGTGNIPSFTAINTSNVPVVATITVTGTGPNPTNCVGIPQSFTITVNPTPIIVATADETICANTATTAIVFGNSVSGATFTWTNSNPSIGLAANSGGPVTGIPSFTGTNVSSVPQTGTIIVTPLANGCPGIKDTFNITIDPLPVMTAVANQTVCDNENTTTINFGSSVLNTTYAWSYTASSNIGLATNSTGNILSFTAVNTGTLPVVATFTVTPTGPASSLCDGNPITFTITVLPRMNPNFTYSSSTYCQTGVDPAPIFAPGANTSGVFTATPAGLVMNSATGVIDLSLSTLNTYTIKYVTPGPCPDSATYNVTITLAPSAVFNYPTLHYCQNGVDPLPTFQLVPPASAGIFSATPAGLTINPLTGEVTAAASAAGTYTVKNYIAAAGGCDSAVATTILIIDSTTILTTPANQVVCNGVATIATNFISTVPGSTYTWANSNTAIGLGGSGTGNIPSFTAVNTGLVPVVATITVTPIGPAPNFCTGLPQTFTYTVNPDASIALTSAIGTNAQTLCIGDVLTNIDYTISGGGTNANVVGLPANVLGSYSAGVYTISGSPTGPAGVYTYTVTTVGSCAQTSATGTITVSPDATLTLTSPVGTNAQTVCINSSIVNITYAVGGTGNGGSVTGLPPNVTGVYAGNVITISGSPSASGSYTYTVTASGTCASTTTTGTINVTPLQNPSFTYSSSTYCQTGVDPSPIFGASATLGGTFSATPGGLVINATTGLIDLSASGLNTYSVKYVTPGPCPDSATFNVTITTAPCATFAYAATNYCQTAVDPTPTFSTNCSAGAFSALPAGLSINTTTGQIDLSLSNAGTYTVTNFIAAASGCAAATATTVVTIDSSTVMNDPADMSVCVGIATSSVIFSGAVVGSGYGWTNSNTAIGLGASGVGNLPTFIPTNAGSTPITATITVTPTGPAPSSCVGVAQTFTITVDPNAIITLTSAAATTAQTPCVNTTINNIIYAISGTGNNATIAWSPSTPTGITGAYVAGVYTISGTPSVTGTYTYTVTATGTCGSATSTGTLVVNPNATVTLTSAAATNNQTVCRNSPITAITYTVGGTGNASSVTGLPPGVNATGTTNISISGTPSVVGSYTYTVTATGTCGPASTTGVINVDPLQDPTFSYPSSTICNTGTACPNAPNTPGGVFSVTPALTAAQFNTTTGCFTLPVTVGNYTVKYVTPGPCKDSMTVTVNVTTAPCTQFSYGSASYCQSSPNPSPTYSTGCSAGTFTYTPAGLSINASNGTINLLASSAGTYTVTNTIAASGTCPASTSTFVVTIVSKPVFTFVSSTPAGCNPTCNGTVTSTITGGTGTYTCTISPATGTVNNTGFASNLCAGTVYTITATDGIGCSGTTTVSVTTAPSPSITVTAFTNTTVLGTPDGTATTSTTGGTGAYTYTVVGPGSINLVGFASGLSGDTICIPHLITVTDAVGCTDTVTVCIGAPGFLMCVPSHTNVSCNGGSNGTLKDSVYGGTSPYTFVSLNNSSGAVAYSPGSPVNVITASGLTADTYTATWIDSNNVSCTNIIVITEPTLLSFNLPVIAKPSCNPGCDGTISIAATGGTAPYTYTIATPAGVTCVATQTTPGNFGGIGVGTYTITTTDAHLCTATITIAVAQSPTPTINISHNNPSCYNVCDGTINAVALAGTPAYTYAITSPAGTTCVPTQTVPTSGNFTTLGGGIYTVVVTDSKGCTNSDTETLVNPGAITIDTLNHTDPSCNASCNGTISIHAVGGTGALNYTLTKPVGAPVTNATGLYNSLCAGTYTVSAHDANCSITATVVITDPPALSWSTATSTNISCAGSANGSISTTATGGTPIIEYSKDGATFFPSGNFTLLLAGTYTITAKDANGCTITTSFTIVEPPLLTLSAPVVGQITCNGANDGTISVVAGGGTPGYSYTLVPGGATNTTGTFTNVGPGTWAITVTDTVGCTKTATGIIVTQPAPLVFTLTNHQDVACFGGNTGSITVNTQGGTGGVLYAILPNTGTQGPAGFFSGLVAGTYTVIATDANNCVATVSVTLAQGPQILVTNITMTEPICNGDANGSISFTAIGGTGQLKFQLNGGLFQTDTVFNNLVAGNYLLTVMDALGCTYDQVISVKEPEPVGAIITTLDANCVDSKDGKAIIVGTGGRGGYKYYLTPGLHINKSGIFTNLEPGNYLLRVVDTAGCEFKTTITINPPANPLANVISKHDLSCNGAGNEGNATANVAGGTPPYTYFWSTNPPQTTPEASTLYYGYYDVTVTDANGCVVKDTVYIEEGPCCEIAFIPNAFSPNGDQLNDEFKVLTTAGVVLIQLEIYNRWGKRVWSTIDYRRGWDGMIDGHDAANDTYYYIFRYTCTRDNKTYTKKGDLILIR